MMEKLAEAEVVVVGGGPSGLATALELRRRGLETVVVETAWPPIDKACGEGIMPDGVERLQELGVEVGEDCSAPFYGIRYLEGRQAAEARFVGGSGLGVRRTELHAAMAERAAQAGAQLLWGVRAEGIAEGGVRTDGGLVVAPWIVGADGLHSRVRRWAALQAPAGKRRRFGVRRHYRLEPWSDLVEVYWGDRCEAYVTPVSPREVGVAVLWSGEKAGFDALIERFPALVERLGSAASVSRDRGAGPFEQRSRPIWRGQVALVGDAAGYRDAITGEGLALAFHQAAALAEAIGRGDLESYGRAVQRLVFLPFALIRGLLLVESRAWLRSRLVSTLASDEDLFERLLAIHARARPLRSLGLGAAGRLARGLLLPPRPTRI
jgi:2-polyprenyl-6-methoxyphenol hydroxylase-like FAD-dependent oxidoreductase